MVNKNTPSGYDSHYKEEPKKKSCKFCGIEFRPYVLNGIPISKWCVKCRIKQEKVKVKKKKIENKDDWRKADDKAWRWYSRWIRASSADSQGFCRCYTCGAIHHWKDMDGGHYEKRQHEIIKYHNKNVRPQCRKCNHFMGGNQSAFAIALEKEFGSGVLQELNELKQTYFPKRTIKELNEIADKYKKLFKELDV